MIKVIDDGNKIMREVVKELESQFDHVRIFHSNPLKIKNNYGTCVFSAAMELLFNCESVPVRFHYKHPEDEIKCCDNKPERFLILIESLINVFDLYDYCTTNFNELYYSNKILFVHAHGFPNIQPRIPNSNHILTGVLFSVYIEGRPHAVSLIRRSERFWDLYSNDEEPIKTCFPTASSKIGDFYLFAPMILRYEYVEDALPDLW